MASRFAKRTGPPGGDPAGPETVLVGAVLRPHGLRGDVKIEVLSDVPGRFEVGRELWLVRPSAQPSAVEAVRPSAQPSAVEAGRPSAQPSAVEAVRPSAQPSAVEAGRPRVRIASFNIQQRGTAASASPGRAIIRFEGYETRELAESIRGCRLEVGLEEVPRAPAGMYYYYELIGCRCVDDRHGDLGEVTAVVEDGGGVLLEVGEAGGRSLLVPFVDPFLGDVDVAGRRIDLRLPPGLLETCASGS